MLRLSNTCAVLVRPGKVVLKSIGLVSVEGFHLRNHKGSLALFVRFNKFISIVSHLILSFRGLEINFGTDSMSMLLLSEENNGIHVTHGWVFKNDLLNLLRESRWRKELTSQKIVQIFFFSFYIPVI